MHPSTIESPVLEVLEALKQIQSGNDAPEVHDKGFNDDVIVNVKPPISPESDEVGLLKTKQLPPSPISVNTNWTSKLWVSVCDDPTGGRRKTV
jgi:hypothetical protein